MKKLILCGLVGLSLLVFNPNLQGAGNNWMSPLDGNRLISQISIPGTHDSGARFEPFSGTAKCQNLTIGEQLEAGVRFLDIRCRHLNDAFVIHHGSVYQNQNFDDVLNAVIGFLNSHPTEAVIMNVKEEYNASGNTRSFEATFDSYVSKNPSKWNLSSSIPTLTQARGKITLFRRFGATFTPKGIDASNWPDNTTFSSGGQLRVQDWYNVSNNNTKWNYILAILNEAFYGGPGTLYVNFASGVQSIFGIPNIPNVSNDINSRLSNFFNSNRNGRFGVVLMDFVDAAKCSIIYNTSFPTDGPVSSPAFFMIVNKYTGKALDLIGGDTGNGARINQWSYDYNGPNQRWSFAPTENSDHFKIVSWVSSKCACMDLDSTSPGAQLHAWDYTGNNPGQQFDLIDAGNGWFKIKNVKSGLILEVANSSTSNDAKVQQNTDVGAANQLWRLQPWGDYFFRADSGKYICVDAMGNQNGALIVQYQYENNPWFKWHFTSESEGWYGLFSLNAPTKVLCVENASTTPGHWCELYDYDPANSGDQKIRISPRTNGKFKFYFAHDNQTWDIPGGQTGNSVELDQYTDNGNAWQLFKMERVP